MAGGKQTLFISASSNGYGNANWYFDDANSFYGYGNGLFGAEGVASNGVATNYVYYNPRSDTNNISRGTNVAAYYSWGYLGGLSNSFPTNGTVIFTNASTWYLMATVESFNGQRSPAYQPESSFLEWFATNAFMGTNSSLPSYTNTPVGVISHVDEPQDWADNTFNYYGLWAAGKSFAICAWAGQISTAPLPQPIGGYSYSDFWFQATGDPFVTK